MLCYLAGMEPYYTKCIKDGPFYLKTIEGDVKPESQWTLDERRAGVQYQRLKSIIMSCLPDDIMESVISCETAKDTWTDLVHSFEGPSDTKENRIMDLKLKYQTFRAKPYESLSQTYTLYKTLLNELTNDGVNISKHEINVDIYGSFVYEDNLIYRRYFDTKKVLITTPSSTATSTAFFSNNVVHNFQENSDDEVDERSSDALLHYDAEMGLMNLILLSIPNEIYNSVDACTTAKEMWKRVERLMRGTIQNQVDRETRFTNEFDQFVVEPGEALVSVYNRFAQLMNDLERNKMIFPIVTVNTKFLNSLQSEWLKYVTQVCLAKRLTVDSFDDLFDYL
ncbi:hypothetical protein Tco_0851788 [Tanacetum coccineum]